MESFPPVRRRTAIGPGDWTTAVDFVNRLNWLFETWDVDAMVDAFLPEGVAYHFHGVVRGRREMRRFFEHDYGYLIPGVSRHATNHIVDADGEGLAVRYHNLLVRHASSTTEPTRGGPVTTSSEDLPAIWIHSPMLDRLRRTPAGWRILERYVGASVTNARLDPQPTAD